MSLSIVGFEHLHLHTTHGSLLDGFGTCQEYANRWQYHGNFLCVSDHGMMAAVPHQIRACDSVNEKQNKKTLQPIYAVELYVNRMHFEATPTEKERTAFIKRLSDDDYEQFKKSNHLLAIAINNEGYKNLVRLSSWGYQNGFYSKPRVNYDILQKNKEGIVFTSCCYASEIGRAFDKKGEEFAEEVLVRYMEMFKGQFYLEIMLLDFKKQKPYDVFILKMKEKYGLPLIVTNDCHYCLPEDSHYQRLMLMMQTNRTLPEIKKMM
jgi:DNA polymerase-3 subunit alpha